MNRVFATILFVAACLGVSSASARVEPRQVLLLYSYEREFSHFTFARLFRPELAGSSPEPINFIEISLQTVRASRTESDADVLEGVRGILGSGRPDLVVTLGGPSASFVQRHKTELFPQTPVLITAVDSRFLDAAPLPAGATALTVKHDPPLILDSMLRLLPDTTTVFVVIGASPVEQFWLREVQRAFRPFEERVSFIWTNEFSFAEMIKHCGSLPPRSAILYGVWSLDAKGVPQMEDQTLDALHAAANAPMFGLHSHQLGHGVVGGPLISMEGLSHESSTVALRLLRGEPAAQIPPRVITAGTPTFDRRELRRWGISESRLEPGSVLRFEAATSSQGNRVPLAAALAVVGAQAALLVALTVTRARRRSALARVGAAEASLAKLSHRLMQAHEHERATIARAIHDDVCQEMTRLTLTLHGLAHERGGATGRLRSRIEELCAQFWTLEREILTLSDTVYHRLELLGLAESARHLCERRCAEAGVALDFQVRDVPDALPPDVSLSVFRALEDALGNTLTHAGAPRVRITLSGAGGFIELEVADEGTGFDVDAVMQRGAAGLVGIRERVRLVGGTCEIDSRPGAGTRIRARVPVERPTAFTKHVSI